MIIITQRPYVIYTSQFAFFCTFLRSTIKLKSTLSIIESFYANIFYFISYLRHPLSLVSLGFVFLRLNSCKRGSEFMCSPYLSLDLIKIQKTIQSNFNINHEMQMITRMDENYILCAF